MVFIRYFRGLLAIFNYIFRLKLSETATSVFLDFLSEMVFNMPQTLLICHLLFSGVSKPSKSLIFQMNVSIFELDYTLVKNKIFHLTLGKLETIPVGFSVVCVA